VARDKKQNFMALRTHIVTTVSVSSRVFCNRFQDNNMSSGGPVLGFELEWYDPVASDVKKLFLKFWVEENTLELVRNTEIFQLTLYPYQLRPEQGQAAFLKKIHYPEVRVQDLYLGSSLTMSVPSLTLPLLRCNRS
jgi:hypothetical protein